MNASVMQFAGIGAIWRRRMLFCAVFAVVVTLTLVALVTLPKRFVATGSVIVAEQEPANADMSAAWAQKMGDPADLESQLLLVRSPRVLRLAMASSGVTDAVRKECVAASQGIVTTLLGGSARSCDLLATDAESFLNYVQARYAVASAGRSRVIDISYTSPFADVAQTMADALVTAFLDDQKAILSQSRENAAHYLWKEVGDLDDALKKEEAQIQDFRRSNDLLRGAYAPITSERLSTVSQQLSAAETARSDAAARLAQITSHEAVDGAGGSGDAPAVLASRSVGDLKQQLTLVTAQLANNATVLGPNHPTLMALRRERDSVEARITHEIAAVTASARKTLDADTAQVSALRRQMSELKAQAGAATEAEASVADMVRDADVKRNQYIDLYKRASALETERRTLTGNTRLVSLAERPDKPFFPRTVPFLAAGLTLATILAVAAAMLRDRMDGSLWNGTSLAQIADVPVLARLPALGRSPRNGIVDLLRNRPAHAAIPDMLAAARRDPALQDGLRNLFAKLSLDNGAAQGSVVLVTSTMPEEGKTITTLALAALMAAAGRRVLVIEGDMRRPVFDDLLGLGPNIGLNAVLRGVAQPRDVVVRTGIPNLDAIPGGRPVSNSTELLLSRSVSDLVKWARSYDFVLIDSPPAGLLMDACILARQVDRVLCCARWGRSQAADTAATVRMLKAAGSGAIGMVVTMADTAGVPAYDLRSVSARRALPAEAA